MAEVEKDGGGGVGLKFVVEAPPSVGGVFGNFLSVVGAGVGGRTSRLFLFTRLGLNPRRSLVN